MTRYSRSVIPGRPQGDNSEDMDRIVFGQKPAANDSDDSDDDISEGEATTLIERAVTDRRKGSRRRTSSDFAPLPDGGGKKYRPSSEGSKRGPLLLVGAMVIVAVFGVVVWNAYRDGVRPEDSINAPQLAQSGAFKTKPDATASDSKFARPDYGATVFEQVEKPKPTVQPAPETHPQVAPPPAPKVTTAPAASTTPAPKTTAPVQAAAPAPTPVKTPAAATVAPPKTTAPVQTAATTPAKTTSPAAVPPPKPTATPPKTTTAVQTAAAVPAKPTTPPAAAAPAPAKPVATAAADIAKPVSLVPASTGAYKPVFAADGKYMVQVAAASDEAGAKSEWDRRAKASPELFATAERLIVQADVNGRTVYRVRAGSFATTADADAFCNAFKGKGGQCFRVAK